jgi:deoxyribodipyrimidine photo-lyase
VSAAVPQERIRAANAAPLRPGRDLVLYWMTASRRVRWNPALERAVELARELGKPLAVLETLRCDSPHASERLHAFVLAGMAENARRVAGRALYHPYVEPARGAGEGLLAALAARACAVVTDDFPTSDLPRAVEAAARAVDVRLEAVDGSCLVPFRLAGKDFPTAHAYRRHLQRSLPRFLDLLPAADPLARRRLPRLEALPAAVARRWPAADPGDLARPARLLAALPIDHRVAPTGARGGSAEGEARLRTFLAERLPRYAEERSSPDAEATSGLSPWLHSGHLSSFEVVRAVLAREGWAPPPVSPRADGSRAGWWGLSPGAEAFLDQVVTWRELGFVTCAHRADHREYASLPGWARATLARHARDRRATPYAREELEAAGTHDRIWNAAQRELVADGVVHGYLRMLWGKKILEWSRSPEEAHETMLHLNDRWALDGRDPNSVSGIAWCLGRYDHPWGPERPVFGTVRYMSSDRTAKKIALEGYLARFGDGPR